MWFASELKERITWSGSIVSPRDVVTLFSTACANLDWSGLAGGHSSTKGIWGVVWQLDGIYVIMGYVGGDLYILICMAHSR